MIEQFDCPAICVKECKNPSHWWNNKTTVCPHCGVLSDDIPRLHDYIESLIAENEALKKQRDDEAWFHAACLSIAEGRLDGQGFDAARFSLAMNACVELRRKYLAFKNWQPSDPGTKEAMEWAARNKNNPLACDHKPMLDALATALTAAMVRLEEAEKRIERGDADVVRILSANAALTASLASVTRERDRWMNLECSEQVPCPHIASLASVTAERDAALKAEKENYQGWNAAMGAAISYRLRAESAEASLAELRKRMGEAEASLQDFMDNDADGEGDYRHCGCYWKKFRPDRGGDAPGHECETSKLVARLASPPSPAPKEESHD